MKEKTLSISPEELEVIVSNVLVKNRPYYHCCHHGMIYAHKNMTTEDYEHPVLDFFRLTGEVSGLPSCFNDYNVTSGICNSCYNKQMNEVKK